MGSTAEIHELPAPFLAALVVKCIVVDSERTMF